MNDLLQLLADDAGFDDPMEMLEEASTDSVVWGICPRCHYITEVEPDQTQGWCENCEAGTVKSCLVIAGII